MYVSLRACDNVCLCIGSVNMSVFVCLRLFAYVFQYYRLTSMIIITYL